MHIPKPSISKSNSGQSMVETALILPLLLMLVFNAINFGYFILVALNLSASPRSGAIYSSLGSATPGGPVLPVATPASNLLTVANLVYQDVVGGLKSPTSATVQVCSKVLGLSGSGASQIAQCVTCTSSAACSVTPGPGTPAPDADPEAPLYVLNRVDIIYTFKPLIPPVFFNLTLLAGPCVSASGSVTCTFKHHVSMRAMD